MIERVRDLERLRPSVGAPPTSYFKEVETILTMLCARMSDLENVLVKLGHHLRMEQDRLKVPPGKQWGSK